MVHRPLAWRFALAALAAFVLLSPAMALPAFQAIGSNGSLAIVDPTRLLSLVRPVATDAAFASRFVTGLARHPETGAVFVVGTDFTHSYLGQVEFTTGRVTTVGRIENQTVVDLAFDGAGTLYGLTDKDVAFGTSHALLRIDPGTAAATVVKVLDAHGEDFVLLLTGAIAWNAAEGALYYADVTGDGAALRLFIDKLTPGTFAQTTLFTSGPNAPPFAMAFADGRLWLATSSANYSANATNLGAGLTNEGTTSFISPAGTSTYRPVGMFPAALPCVPGPTTACLAHRFKVEVTYDALPANGTGPANVVLESAESVKFTFFNPANIEMILKVLDACGPFGKWWVFAGGLTDVGVTIRVTDTRTGSQKTYTNPKGHLFETFADTGAFACP